MMVFHADPHPGNLLFHVLTKEEQTRARRTAETVHEKEFGPFAFRASTSQKTLLRHIRSTTLILA